MMAPKVICAGVGAKENLSAGIRSAAAVRCFASLLAKSRNASATGADWAAATPGRRAKATARSETRIGMAPRLEETLMLRWVTPKVQPPQRQEAGPGSTATGVRRCSPKADRYRRRGWLRLLDVVVTVVCGRASAVRRVVLVAKGRPPTGHDQAPALSRHHFTRLQDVDRVNDAVGVRVDRAARCHTRTHITRRALRGAIERRLPGPLAVLFRRRDPERGARRWELEGFTLRQAVVVRAVRGIHDPRARKL